MIGAQTINPNIKVKIIWVNSWFDPGKEADAAKALLDQGADIIMQHTDSPAPMQVASERGKFAFGQDSEMIKFGPKAQLTSILDTWAPYYIARVKAEMTGTWKEEDTWGGLDSKMFAMAPYTNMPDEVKEMAEDTQAALAAGKLQPFKCPIVDQDGKTVSLSDLKGKVVVLEWWNNECPVVQRCYRGDAMNLPVADVDAAIPFYEKTFGFRVVTRKEVPHKSVILARDEIQIGLAENGGDP